MSDNPEPPGGVAGGQDPGAPVNWEVARQVAGTLAGGGQPDADPAAPETHAFEAIVRAAEMALDRAGSLRHPGIVHIRVRGRSGWAMETLDSLKPVIEQLAGRFSAGGGLGMLGGAIGGADTEGDAMARAMQQAIEAVVKPLAPVFTGLQMGMVVGLVATRALSQYDLCLPREGDGSLSFAARNIDEAAAEMDVPRDDLRLWVALHELAHHSLLSVGWAARRLRGLLEAYLASIRVDLGALQEQLGQIDPQDPESLRRLADSEGLLGQLISTDQPDVLESLRTFMAVLESYAEFVTARAATGLLPEGGAIVEGLRRRREQGGEADRMLENLLGVELSEDHLRHAQDFCTAVAARAGMDTLNRMWEATETLPTLDELTNPDAWISRMETTPPGGLYGGDTE